MCIQTTTLRGRNGQELAAGVAMQQVYLVKYQPFAARQSIAVNNKLAINA
jgi:hypothetical protein